MLTSIVISCINWLCVIISMTWIFQRVHKKWKGYFISNKPSLFTLYYSAFAEILIEISIVWWVIKTYFLTAQQDKLKDTLWYATSQRLFLYIISFGPVIKCISCERSRWVAYNDWCACIIHLFAGCRPTNEYVERQYWRTLKVYP